jgi:hypothetical protein
MVAMTASATTPAKPVFFKRMAFSSTHVFQPLCNRETNGSDFLRGNSVREKFKNFLIDIKNDPNPFTRKAKDINGQPLRGIHTKDTAMGKLFRLFRLALVGISLAAPIIVGIVGMFAAPPLAISIPIFVCAIGVPVLIDGAYAKDKLMARRASAMQQAQ